VGTASDRAASSLLSRLQQKKQKQWEEAVNSIDFSHSSHKAWRTINKLTGRSGRSSRPCPVLTPEARKISGTPSSQSLYSTPGRLSNLGSATSSIPACAELKIPKIWRRALVVAIPKPEKSLGDPKSYRAISLLCVPFEIIERLIYARVKTITDPLLPQEQAGFRHGSSDKIRSPY